MTRGKKTFLGAAAILLIAGLFTIAELTAEPNRPEKAAAGRRRDFAEDFGTRTDRRGTHTEHQYDYGLVIDPCTDETILHAIADREMREQLHKFDFEYIRCADGKPVGGKGIWWEGE